MPTQMSLSLSSSPFNIWNGDLVEIREYKDLPKSHKILKKLGVKSESIPKLLREITLMPSYRSEGYYGPSKKCIWNIFKDRTDNPWPIPYDEELGHIVIQNDDPEVLMHELMHHFDNFKGDMIHAATLTDSELHDIAIKFKASDTVRSIIVSNPWYYSELLSNGFNTWMIKNGIVQTQYNNLFDSDHDNSEFFSEFESKVLPEFVGYLNAKT